MKRLKFKAKLWRWPGEKAAWHFVSVPKAESAKIGKEIKVKRGWGSVRVRAKIGGSTFDTSVFPDKKSGTYLLPVKASIRRMEGLEHGDTVDVILDLK
ncbi:MAG: DUF1905 domain-containing protein [Patescibacteria group bacterium]